VNADERYTDPGFRAVELAAALDEVNVRPDDRVLVMLPDGPGFTEAIITVTRRGAVPLPLNPLLSAHDVTSAAAESGARLVLSSVDRVYALADLEAKPPVLVDGPQGLWAAILRLR
jgi:acyl-CoA synthetase (AMP-forming)/AMP-acid ligase II